MIASFVVSSAIAAVAAATYAAVSDELFSCLSHPSWHLVRHLIGTTFLLKLLVYLHACNSLVVAPLKWVLEANEKLTTKSKSNIIINKQQYNNIYNCILKM